MYLTAEEREMPEEPRHSFEPLPQRPQLGLGRVPGEEHARPPGTKSRLFRLSMDAVTSGNRMAPV